MARTLAMAFAAAVGAVWNLETGVMIEVGLGAFLVGKWILLFMRHRVRSGIERRRLAGALLLQVLVFAGFAGGMAAWLAAKGDRGLHPEWIFTYQHLFYNMGYPLLPLHFRPNPWMAVLALYLFAMLAAVATWVRSPQSRGADLIFYLSFLGLGLFVYYEGRAHVFNLFSVVWPALTLSVILADRVVRAVRAGILGRASLSIAAVAQALVLLCCIPVVTRTPDLVKNTVRMFETPPSAPLDPVVADELAFIRAHSRRGETCLILSQRQGIYHAATGTISPIHGPGYVELVTRDDQEALKLQLPALNVEDAFVGVGPVSGVEFDFNPLDFLKQYSVEATSSKGTMLHLRLKK
jgi:hypothetical protein